MRGLFLREAVSRGAEETGAVGVTALVPRVGADEMFIESLRAGDRDAFDELADRYTGEIFRLLFRLTQNREDAEDLTQEVFLKAVRSIGSFRGESDIRTWLYRIAVNAARNRFRWWTRRGRDKTLSLETAIRESDTTIGETVTSKDENPEEALLRREREEMLHRALGEIGEVYREAVVLCDLQGLKYEEISDLLGISVGTVKSRIARGRDELRKRLRGI